jgi:23S rRNA pseudouridine1911/1915/1917 synthase
MDNIQVLYEDNHLIAVNKPAGWLVQGDETGDTPLSEWVKAYIKNRYGKPGDVFLGVIHRLDRPVSGVVVFARTSKALERMNLLFKEREIKKTYLAITTERPEPLRGTLTHYILKDREKNVAKAFDQLSNRSEGAKKSILEYEMIAQIGGHFLLRIHPETGRPHQIRVQLSKIGNPIKGDVKYGHPNSNRTGSIYLHCYKLEFVHPVKKDRVEIVAELPDDQSWNLFRELVHSAV